MKHLRFATAVEQSHDRKLTMTPKEQVVSATYVAKVSCPSTCRFFDGNGCYADTGRTGVHTHRLNRVADALNATALAAAIAEAAAIDKLTGKHDLRLHVVGDCASNETARIVAAASERYIAKHGRKVWTYTHAWRVVDRESWGKVSVLASCETGEDVDAAIKRGYAVAMVVADFESMPATVAGTKAVACPQMTGKRIDCESCGACKRDSRLYSRVTIAFKAHGVQAGAVRQIIQAV